MTIGVSMASDEFDIPNVETIASMKDLFHFLTPGMPIGSVRQILSGTKVGDFLAGHFDKVNRIASDARFRSADEVLRFLDFSLRRCFRFQQSFRVFLNSVCEKGTVLFYFWRGGAREIPVGQLASVSDSLFLSLAAEFLELRWVEQNGVLSGLQLLRSVMVVLKKMKLQTGIAEVSAVQIQRLTSQEGEKVEYRSATDEQERQRLLAAKLLSDLEDLVNSLKEDVLGEVSKCLDADEAVDLLAGGSAFEQIVKDLSEGVETIAPDGTYTSLGDVPSAQCLPCLDRVVAPAAPRAISLNAKAQSLMRETMAGIVKSDRVEAMTNSVRVQVMRVKSQLLEVLAYRRDLTDIAACVASRQSGEDMASFQRVYDTAYDVVNSKMHDPFRGDVEMNRWLEDVTSGVVAMVSPPETVKVSHCPKKAEEVLDSFVDVCGRSSPDISPCGSPTAAGAAGRRDGEAKTSWDDAKISLTGRLAALLMSERKKAIKAVIKEVSLEVNFWESLALLKGLTGAELNKAIIASGKKPGDLLLLKQIFDQTEANCREIKTKFDVYITALTAMEAKVGPFLAVKRSDGEGRKKVFLAGGVTASGADNRSSIRSITCIKSMLTEGEVLLKTELAADAEDVIQAQAFGPNDKCDLPTPSQSGTFEGLDEVSLLSATSDADVVVDVKADHGLNMKALMAVGVDGRSHPIFAYRLTNQMLRTAAAGPDGRLVLFILLFCYSGLVARDMQLQWKKLRAKYPRRVEKIRCVVLASSFGGEDSLATTPQASCGTSDVKDLVLWLDVLVAALREAWQANPTQKFTDLRMHLGPANLPMIWTTEAAENATLADVFQWPRVPRLPFGRRDIPISSRSDLLLTTGENGLINAGVAGASVGSGRLKAARRHLQPAAERDGEAVGKVPLDRETLGDLIFAGVKSACGEEIPPDAEKTFRDRRIPAVSRSSCIPLTLAALHQVKVPDHVRFGVQSIAAFSPMRNDVIVAAVVKRYIST
jgi:hypothetical protein